MLLISFCITCSLTRPDNWGPGTGYREKSPSITINRVWLNVYQKQRTEKTEFSIGFKYLLTCRLNVLHLMSKNIGLSRVSQDSFQKTCLNFGVNRVLFMEVTLLRPRMLHKKATRDIRKSPEHVTEAANPSVCRCAKVSTHLFWTKEYELKVIILPGSFPFWLRKFFIRSHFPLCNLHVSAKYMIHVYMISIDTSQRSIYQTSK